MENRNLDIGYVFEKTFSIVGQRISELAILSLVLVGIPNIILSFISAQMLERAVSSGNSFAMFSPSYLIMNFLIGLLPILLQAAVIHTTVEAMASRTSDFGSSLSVALRSFLPLLILSIILSIAYTIGLMLLVVPGLILMTLWVVAVPCLVVEKTGIFGSLGRSFDLTEGQRWRIFALMVIAFIAMIIAGLIVGMLSFGAMAGTQSYENFATFSLWSALLNAVLAMAAGVVGAVGVSVLYVHLRDLKEGTSLDTIGDVFR